MRDYLLVSGAHSIPKLRGIHPAFRRLTRLACLSQGLEPYPSYRLSTDGACAVRQRAHQQRIVI